MTTVSPRSKLPAVGNIVLWAATDVCKPTPARWYKPISSDFRISRLLVP